MQAGHRIKIGIVELGRVGLTTLKYLLRLGLRDFVLADNRTVSLTDVVGELTYRRADLGQRRVEAATRVLEMQFPGTQFDKRAGPESGPLWSAGWLSQCDICLFACDAAAESVVFEVNSACLSARIPLIPGLAMGSVGQ